MREIPFYKPSIGEEEVGLINEALLLKEEQQVQQEDEEEESILPPVKPQENMAQKLEKEVSQYVSSKHAVSTNNATAALHLALCAMDLKRGDKIICSVNSFPAVAEVVRHFDAEPIFVDIDKDDFNIDPRQLERVLRMHQHKKLKCAFVGHMAGQTADLDSIYDIANQYKIKIIDEASDALGASYNGKKIGNTGSYISCFRFEQQTRYALAAGGIITSNDEEIARRAKLLRNHAIISDSWDEYGNLGYVYDVVDVGVKYDLSEICSAFNLGQMSHIDARIKRRQQIAKIYDKELSDCPHISTPIKKRDHIYSKYIIKIDKNRDNFAKKLREKGIYTGLHYVPLHLLQYYKNKYSLKVSDFPNALANYQQILSLPIYASMSDEDVAYVCETIKKIASDHV